LDGSAFSPVGAVSPASALLLPNTAVLCYTPDGINGETATISYYAWDATSGSPGGTIDTTSYGGGTTAISLDWDIASLRVNDAPLLTPASPSMGVTNEDTTFTTGLSGTFINNGPGTTTITDIDAGAVVGGIALTGVSGRGTWSYSLDGTAFNVVGTVSAGSALLLPATAQLRYAPDLMNGETVTITYCAWDATSGSAGMKVSTANNGGTTAFSSATDTASLTVTDVNDAPVLTPAAPSLGITNQTTAIVFNLSGTFINHGTGTTTITDVDYGAVVGGIALKGTTGGGAWSYSLDGAAFNPVGTVNTFSALLLPSTAQLCYTPNPPTGGPATITYCAWDMTSGAPGAKASTWSNGGTTAFSSASDTATLTLDYTPPRVTVTSPSLTGGTLAAGTASLAFNFSETVVGAGTAANYQLQSAGPDGLLGTADDVTVPLAVSYSGGWATLTFSPLPENVYRLTADDAVTDLAGNKLDGNGDGLAGGNWTADFVAVPSSSLLAGAASFSAGSSPYGIAAGDFNGDGIPDLAVANNISGGTVHILLGDGKGAFTAGGTYSSGGSSPRTVAVADFNNDGKPDIAVANYGSGTVGILYGAGAGGFAPVVTYSTVGNTQGLAIGDFNSDGKPDIATTNWGGGTVGVLLSKSGGGFTATSITTGDSWPDDIAAADFNGDGKLDLVVANGFSNTVRILLGNGSGGFSIGNAYNSGVSWTQGIAVGDFNGDGNKDVVTSGVSSSAVGVLLSDGHGGLGTVTTFATGGSGPFGLATADFNNDGKLDIAVSNTNSNNVSVFVGNGSGSFSAATNFSTGGTAPKCIVAGDFNGDGRIDLAAADNGSGTVGVLMNFSGPAPVVLTSPHSLPFDVAVGSFGAGELVQGYNNAFDGDGRLIVGGTPFQPGTPTYSTADSGQSVITANGAAAGLTVSRKITVPNTGGQDFARTVDVFTNSTGLPVSTAVTIVGNLGSDAATNVFATSDGTGIVSPNDQWIGTDDATDGGGTPAIIHYIHGPAGLQPASVSVIGDNIEWTYNLTVPAGQTVRLAYFTIVNTTRAGAIAAANALVSPAGFGGQAGAFLSSTEVASLANFLFPPLATVALNTHGPRTDDVLTATATKSDFYGNPVTLTYVWTVNGVVQRTFTSATALSDSFDLSVLGNGDSGDVVTVAVTPSDGTLNGATVTDTATVAHDLIAPTVTNVVLGSDRWSSSFLTYLTTLSGENVGGYSIPVGSGAQLLPLPWVNIDEIMVTFSENVAVSQAELTLVGVNTAQYNVAGGTFSYDPVHFIATWTLTQPIADDKLLLSLNADGANPITDLAGNRLDGEWTNPTSTSDTGTSTYPSGNGVAGGNFNFRFNVLPGDANQSGGVGNLDTNLVANAGGQVIGDSGYSIFYDVNGSGGIGNLDTNLVRNNGGSLLPVADPVAPGVVVQPPAGAVVPGVAGDTPAAATATSGGPTVAATTGDSPAAVTEAAAAPVASGGASVPAVAAPIASPTVSPAASAVGAAPSAAVAAAVTPAGLVATTAAPVARGGASVPAAAPLSGLPAPDAGPAIVSSVPDSPAAAARPVAAAREDGSVGSAAWGPADGWAMEQLVLREAALVEDAGTAALAGGSQTAARDAWFAEFGGRPAPSAGDAVGLDTGPSPAARSPVMAGEAGTDAGATFYRQLALTAR
jgi:hypothetical protein